MKLILFSAIALIAMVAADDHQLRFTSELECGGDEVGTYPADGSCHLLKTTARLGIKVTDVGDGVGNVAFYLEPSCDGDALTDVDIFWGMCQDNMPGEIEGGVAFKSISYE